MPEFMVLPRGTSSMVKTIELFNSQDGRDRKWGEEWKPITAKDLEHAKLQASIMPPVDSGFGPRVKFEHVRAECIDPDCGGSCNTCNLFICKNCGAYEGGLPTECPMRIIYFQESDDIYKGLLDFRDGQWSTKHRSIVMYPQDAVCEYCRGENQSFEREYSIESPGKLIHKAKSDPGITVRCNYSTGDV
jgi:hypothetical protein